MDQASLVIETDPDTAASAIRKESVLRKRGQQKDLVEVVLLLLPRQLT